MRLRRGYTLTDMSYQFKMGQDKLSCIFVTFLQLMYNKFQAMRSTMFAPLSHHSPMPSAFRNPLLSKVRVVIDCTEFAVQSSKDYKQQGHLYSSYKSRTTAKVLIGVAPSGAGMFCSDAYEGAISDREITTKSGFLTFIGPGDVVLADKGFTIHDLLAEKDATLVIPPFLKDKGQLTPEQLALTKIIARARIHVERYNDRVKNFKILDQTIPHYLLPLLSQIVFVVCCIVNFQEPLCQ